MFEEADNYWLALCPAIEAAQERFFAEHGIYAHLVDTHSTPPVTSVPATADRLTVPSPGQNVQWDKFCPLVTPAPCSIQINQERTFDLKTGGFLYGFFGVLTTTVEKGDVFQRVYRGTSPESDWQKVQP